MQFFKVENSEWIAKTFKNKNQKHFVFIDKEKMVDVISSSSPKVKLIK